MLPCDAHVHVVLAHVPQVAPACSNVVGATKDGAKCSQLRAGMCQQAEACSDLFETYVDQLAALRREAANLRVRVLAGHCLD